MTALLDRPQTTTEDKSSATIETEDFHKSSLQETNRRVGFQPANPSPSIETPASPKAHAARRRPYRGPLIALALFGVGLLCATIIITIKDKDGKVVGQMEVPENGSFEVTQPDPTTHDATQDPRNTQGLFFDGIDDTVEVPSLQGVANSVFTIETIASLESSGLAATNLVKFRGVGIGSFRLKDGGIALKASCLSKEGTDLKVPTASAGSEWQFEDDATHLAATFDGNELSFFLNGKLQKSVKVTAPVDKNTWLGSGHWKDQKEHGLSATLHAVRFSEGLRYENTFVPPSSLESDDDTIALYRFEEDTGNKLVDLSGNGHVGLIRGATWVKSRRTSGNNLLIEGDKFTIEEPPPLDEWLKGREIITVKQDGTADFTTIQAAQDALKEGQVVEVLDEGPYSERLQVDSPPNDTGLVSRVATTILNDEWVEASGSEQYSWIGHRIANARTFRLEGIEFRTEKQARFRLVEFSNSLDVVVRGCGFICIPHSQSLVREDEAGCRDGVAFGYSRKLERPSQCQVTNCFFSGVSVELHAAADNTETENRFFLTNSLFVGDRAPAFTPRPTTVFRLIRISENVISVRNPHQAINIGKSRQQDKLHLHILNNTLDATWITAFGDVPHNVVLKGNLLSGIGFRYVPSQREVAI